MNQEPISRDEMKIKCLIANEPYKEQLTNTYNRTLILVFQNKVYWLVDNQWWDYPRMSEAKAKSLIG